MTGRELVVANPKPAEPWRQRLIRSLLYGRNVDRAAKARARVGFAILAFAAIYAVIGGRLVMYATIGDSHGTVAHLFDRDRPLTYPAAALAGTTYLLASVPPDAAGYPVIDRHSDALAELDGSIAWAGYLSTTGVYGDRDGGWQAFSAIANFILVAGGIAIALLMVFARPLAGLVAPGFTGPGEVDTLVRLASSCRRNSST